MKKIIILILSFLATSSLTFGASNLWEYHKEKGLKFPSFEERKEIFENEIGSEEYTGTAEQNKAYLDYLETFNVKLGAGVYYPAQGGTGISNVPTYGQMLVGNSGGTYTLTATSSLGISGGSGTFSWTPATNYGENTNSTTTAIWIRENLYASSTIYAPNFTAESTTATSTLPRLSITTGISILGEYFENFTTYVRSLFTAGDGITLTGGDFDCDTASGSVFGCLASADWTTFNNKQATISATWPITLSGAAVGFNGLSTSTAAVVGNLPYFSGVNTFANVATTTLTGTAPMVFSNPISVIGGSASVLTCTAASGSVAGCLSSADWTTFNSKQATISATWPITLSGATLGFNGLSTTSAAVVGNIPYFSGVNTFANVATSTIGAGTGLSFSGTSGYQIGGTNGTFSVNTSQNIVTLSNLTSNGFVKTSGGVGTLSVDTTSYLSGTVGVANGGTGQTSFGQGWLHSDGTTITSSTSPTVAYITATSTTATSTLINTDISQGRVKMHTYPAFEYSTSTAWTATTTIYLAPAYTAETWNGAKCETDVGTVNVSFYDGTNRMNMITASTTIGTFTFSTNNSFNASETRRVDIGTPASSPTKISCSIDKTINP